MGRSVSAETVRNVIRHGGYRSRETFHKLTKSERAFGVCKNSSNEDITFGRKLFSDESKFNIFGSDGRRTVWRNPNTALDPKNLHPTVKHGGVSVMATFEFEIAVQKHQIRNKSHLKQVLQEEWDKIFPDTTKKIGRIGTKTFGGHYKSQRTCNQILTLSFSYDIPVQEDIGDHSIQKGHGHELVAMLKSWVRVLVPLKTLHKESRGSKSLCWGTWKFENWDASLGIVLVP
ncbi:transposable element Tc1 transposase [Trichonephila clavipes]|nr:transposable element Tc1 transposase [Trichonephila clavipes]